jgi:hypothetical protein
MRTPKRWRLVGTISWTGTENIDGSFEQGCDIDEHFVAPTKPAAIRNAQRLVQIYSRQHEKNNGYRMSVNLLSVEPVWTTRQGKT